MTNTIIRRVIMFGAFSIISLLFVQAYWVVRTWNLQEREFNRKVNQALLDAANILALREGFALPTQKLVQQLSSNYWVVNINQFFEADALQYSLGKAFEKQGLKEDYEYGIFDCSGDQMVKGELVKYAPSKENKALEEFLPKHYDSDFIYYYGIRFPNKSNNILSNMWWVVGFTFLILITIGFFVYSMFVILRQKQLSELQRDFINNMTHEFKTPIATINISTDVFLKSEVIKNDERLNRYAGIIKEQVMRLNTQVEKVLQLAKIERDKIELHYEKIDLNRLVNSILPSIELKVSERDGKLENYLDAENPVVWADRLHLTNIIHNLVDNGVKYSKANPEIKIAVQQNGNEVILSIKDSGIGIAKEDQKHIFDKFYRVPTGNVHNVKGFGLGLFYVKSICNAHKWKLDLFSTPGQGTTIEIRMPHEP